MATGQPPHQSDETRKVARTDSDQTQSISPLSTTRPYPPQAPPPTPHAEDYVLSGKRERAPQRVIPPPGRSKSDSGLYLPAWSVGLMFLGVLAVSAAVFALVFSLGGRSTPGGEPRVIVITAQFTSTLAFTAVSPTPLAFPVDQGIQLPTPTFALQGPTLVPVVLTSTPVSLGTGVTVVVYGVEDTGLNVRSGPGINQEIRFVAQNGSTFSIIGGPTQADGRTWWQLQDPFDTERSGWAVADYLETAS